MRIRLPWFCVLAGFSTLVPASMPRIPFSAAFGATDGAGAAVGWERHGLGVNPAAHDSLRVSASFAGYSPFGLDGIRIVEAAAAWDGVRWGASLSYRGNYSEAGSAAAWRVQESFRLGWGTSAGVAAQFQADAGGKELGGSAGLIWNRFPFLSLGGFAEVPPGPGGPDFSAGADAGTRLPGGYAWRVGAEVIREPDMDAVWRFGAVLRLHSLLSVHGGWSPRTQTSALGIRFGLGGWEGFSALRRHAALGTTSIQGLRWQRDLKSGPDETLKMRLKTRTRS